MDYPFSGIQVSENLRRSNGAPQKADTPERLQLASSLGNDVEDGVLSELTGQTGVIRRPEVVEVYRHISRTIRPYLTNRLTRIADIAPVYRNLVAVDNSGNPCSETRAVLTEVDSETDTDFYGKFTKTTQRQLRLMDSEDAYDEDTQINLRRYSIDAALGVVQVSNISDSLLRAMYLNRNLRSHVLGNVHINAGGIFAAQFDGAIVGNLFSEVANWLGSGESNGQLNDCTWSILEVKTLLSPRFVSGKGLKKTRQQDEAELRQKLADLALLRAINGEPVSFPDNAYFLYPRGIMPTQIFRIAMNEKYYFDWYQDFLRIYVRAKKELGNDSTRQSDFENLKSVGLILGDEVKRRRNI